MMRLKVVIVWLFLQKYYITYVWQWSKYASVLLQKIFFVYSISRVKYLNLELLNRIFSVPSAISVYFFYHFLFESVSTESKWEVFMVFFLLLLYNPYLNQDLAGHNVFLLIPGLPLVTPFVIVKSPWKFLRYCKATFYKFWRYLPVLASVYWSTIM